MKVKAIATTTDGGTLEVEIFDVCPKATYKQITNYLTKELNFMASVVSTKITEIKFVFRRDEQ